MKIKSLILVFLLSIGFSSCDDMLDIQQPGEINPEVIFQNIDTFENALNFVYATFPYQNTMLFSAVFTDEIKLGITNGGQGIGDGLYGFVLNDQSGSAASIWQTHHFTINRANRVILGAASVPVATPEEQERVNHIVAQARFLRALALIQALPYFTTDLADVNALGIIAFEDIPNPFDQRQRSTNGVIYDLIAQDLDFAENNLIVLTTNVERVRRANLDACKAIRAKVAIYRKQYPLALTLSDELIASYPLCPLNLYPFMWNDQVLNERIFHIFRQVGDATFSGLFSNVRPGVNNNNWYEMGRGLFGLYAQNDVRRSAFTGLNFNSNVSGPPVISTVSPDPENDPDYRLNDQICINKYPGKETATPYLNDYKILRVSEFYFIKAEAQIGLGNRALAAQTIKQLRDARHSTTQPLPAYANDQQAYADVLLERRKELCFEGFRYIDVKRLGALANVTFTRFSRDCDINNSCNSIIQVGDHRFTMPIPASELNANTVITQNPNY